MSDQNKSSKLDVQSILGNLKNLKNIIPQSIGTPEPVDGDSLGIALADLSVKAKEAAKAHADITQTLYDIESGINKLYDDIETLRGEIAAAKEESQTVETVATEEKVEETTGTVEVVEASATEVEAKSE